METGDNGSGGTLVGNPQSSQRTIKIKDTTSSSPANGPAEDRVQVVSDDGKMVTLVLKDGREVSVPASKIENYGHKDGTESINKELTKILPKAFDSGFTPSKAYPQISTQLANEVKKMKQQADKRDKNGIRTKDNFNEPRVEDKHEDVCPANESVCPCTEERDARPVKTFVGTASEEPQFVKEASKLTPDQEKLVKTPFNTVLTASAKKDLLEKTAMYDAVYMMPGKCQWCPKLRNAVSMHTCATVCPEGRRIPQKKENETYTDYLMKGGSDEGEVKCGLKQWMEVEMDKFYPGWVEDHIKAAGGSVAGSETNFGNRRMNLDPDERRHLPRYPEEKLIEKVLERERHYYDANETKLASNNAKQIKLASGCDQCASTVINGVLCHEHGCPDAYKSETRTCRLCKDKFKPSYSRQRECEDCANEGNDESFASKNARFVKQACKECGCGHDCKNDPRKDCKCKICKEHFENK